MLLSKVTYNVISDIHFVISMSVPWELNPQPLALLTQCSTIESQEHINYISSSNDLGRFEDSFRKAIASGDIGQ